MTLTNQEKIHTFDAASLANLPAEAPLNRGERIRERPPEKPKQKHRSIFLSDMHLGTRSARADLILDFLETHSAETVYLVGDIVDNWYPLSNWKPAHHQVLQRLFDLPGSGTRAIYVPGNHALTKS